MIATAVAVEIARRPRFCNSLRAQLNAGDIAQPHRLSRRAVWARMMIAPTSSG